jgi:hypothetical protein
VISPYYLTIPFFSMGFDLVLKGFIRTEILLIKDYINEILESKTISTWINYKNLFMILASVGFIVNEPLDSAYTLGVLSLLTF